MQTELVSNRKAFHLYEILDSYEAGMVLLGSEVKALKAHQGNLQDAYVLVSDGQVILKNSSIAPYSYTGSFGHEERRDRKLLLHKREIEKLNKAAQDTGLTLIPLSIYLKNGLIKVKVGVARGKKQYDKRASIRERDEKRKIAETMKRYNRN